MDCKIERAYHYIGYYDQIDHINQRYQRASLKRKI
ncbi:MAG: hypothetical protein ACI837_001696 [Crocinitomicaceae bacterium]|jgi:hypothetical protein